MKNIFLILVLASLQHANAIFLNWRNMSPFAKDIPKEEIKSKIELRIVKKEWFPWGAEAPQTDDVIPKYPGSLREAYNLFNSDKTMYEYNKEPLMSAVALLKEENGYRQYLESIFVIHTISGDANNLFVKNTIIAFALRNFLKKYNVFAFSMPGLHDSMEQTIAKSMYGRKANFQDLGEAIGDFFNSAIEAKLMELDKIHLFGFCYSSQLSGYIARYIASKNGDKKIKSITALDPYSAFLSGIRNKVLCKHDAQLVYAYHTNSIFHGSMYRKATADFNLNSGLMQPGCYTSRSIMCSHRRAVMAFWYVILYPNLWMARRCDNYIAFRTCLCSLRGIARLTFPPVPGARGTYYLNTLRHEPYGFGPTGANCISVSRKNKANKITSNDRRPEDVDFGRALKF